MNLLSELRKRFKVVPGKFRTLKDGTRSWSKSGSVVWLNNTGSGKYLKHAGSVAGSLSAAGYLVLAFRCEGKHIKVFAHRAAWSLNSGKLISPKLQCDHMDHNITNNDPRNLRAVKAYVNGTNKVASQKNSRFGLLGVSWYEERGKWSARIKKIDLGYFEDPIDAVKVYWNAKLNCDPDLAIHWNSEMKKQIKLARSLRWVRENFAPKRGKYVKSSNYPKTKSERLLDEHST